MKHLIIDAGNTRVKVVVFKEDSLIEMQVCDTSSLQATFLNFFSKHCFTQAILSSVGGLTDEIRALIPKEVPLLVLSNTTKVPFQNLYKTPKTLGVDRIALVSAASVQFPKQNVLVIDAGTCVTFDCINASNSYLGGAISPGLQMRYTALNTFTEKLPKLTFDAPKHLIGDDTETSMHSGVVNGLVAEINGIIDAYRDLYSDLTVVLTGGDMNYLSKRLKNGIFANPNFLIEGLDAILKYNTHE